MIGKKILITGGAGFIGKTLSNELIKKNFDVLVVDDLSSGIKNGLDKNIEFSKLDILDLDKIKNVFKKYKPDIVFHLAAKSSRDPNNLHVLNNIQGTLNVILCCLEYPPEKFVFSSSASVYGQASKFPTKEAGNTLPINNYGISKLASESLTVSMLEAVKIPYVILRFSNVYGPGQRSDNEGGIVSILITNIINKRKITVYSDGQQSRDFIYIDDVIAALIHSVKPLKSDRGAIINIATGKETSINKLISTLSNVTGCKIDIVYKNSDSDEIKRSVLNNSLGKDILKWSPNVTIVEGLQKTYNILNVDK